MRARFGSLPSRCRSNTRRGDGGTGVLTDSSLRTLLKVVDDLIAQVSTDVARLGYRQVGRHVTELPGELDHTRTLFFDQFVYQHMEGYLRGMELGALMNTATFFSPLE